MRQWLLAATDGIQKPELFEDFATTAYTNLAAYFFPESLPTLLKPKAEDGIVARIESVYDKQVSGAIVNWFFARRPYRGKPVRDIPCSEARRHRIYEECGPRIRDAWHPRQRCLPRHDSNAHV